MTLATDRQIRATLAVLSIAVASFGLLALGAMSPGSPPLPFAGAAEAMLSTTTTTSAPAPTTTEAGPNHDVAASTPVATPNGVVTAYDEPGGTAISEVGVWYGYELTLPILEERDDWLHVRLPERPNGLTGWVRADEVTTSTTDWHLIVDLSDTTLYAYKDGVEEFTAPLGIGRDHTRTPTGSYFVAVIQNPAPAGYGPIVVALNAHSEDIQSWDGTGDAITAFHGPFGAQSLLRSGGGKVSNGCMRMLEEDQVRLAPVPLGSPVDIIE